MIHNASFERPAANPGRGNVQRMLLRFLRGYQEASHRSGQRGSFMVWGGTSIANYTPLRTRLITRNDGNPSISVAYSFTRRYFRLS